MPTFCRHNRLIQNCPICSREQEIEMRPVVSSGAPRTGAADRQSPPRPRPRAGRGDGRSASSPGLRVSRLARAEDDGYRSPLVPGLRSSVDAERLAEELAFAVARLKWISVSPPGLYAEVAQGGDVEERAWLAFLIAYLCPLDGEDPFEAIRVVRVPWASAAELQLDEVETGPRTAHDAGRGLVTIEAYRGWAARAGSQGQAFTGEESWTAERRFARVYERLALPGLPRDARFDLLVTLGRVGVFELRAGALALGGENQVTLAAKRALGIGDPLLLERRSAELAEVCELPLEALDVGFYNWGRPPDRGERATLGLGTASDPDPVALEKARSALEL